MAVQQCDRNRELVERRRDHTALCSSQKNRSDGTAINNLTAAVFGQSHRLSVTAPTGYDPRHAASLSRSEKLAGCCELFGLWRRLFEPLLAGEWISRHENLAIIGPTGIGKSWLACAIGHKACRDNRSVLYTRLPR